MSESGVVTGAAKQRSYNGDYMQRGKEAERIVMRFLEYNSNVIGVDDLRQLRVMRESDVDLSVKLMDGRVILAEIKSDWYLGVSGNVLFESLRINHTASPNAALTLGWSARSPANWLLYYAPQKKSLYIGSFGAFRSAMQKYTKDARKQTRIDYVETDSIKSTINILIPWRYCQDVFNIYDLTFYAEAQS